MLVVEDDWVLAEDLRQELHSLGAEVLGPAPTVTQAHLLLNEAGAAGTLPNLAILDVSLGGESVFPVAEDLASERARRGVGGGQRRPVRAHRVGIIRLRLRGVAVEGDGDSEA